MADPFTGEIRIFSGSYAPRDWAVCDGTLMSIQQNPTLYSIIGVQFGGDGKNTFGLPNLNGMAPLHQGTGTGLTPRSVGQGGGSKTVTLTTATMPNHTHAALALAASGNINHPDGALWAENVIAGRTPLPQLQYATVANATMNPAALAATGGSTAHNNMQPYLPLCFIICLSGEYPVHS